jgi:uncharacterized protein YecT (DUF1311 family)
MRCIAGRPVHITPESSRENDYCESFNAKLRDELLNEEIFYTMRQARLLIEQWRVHYHTIQAAQRAWISTASARNHWAYQ